MCMKWMPLLNGSNGKISQKLDRTVSYGSIDKADTTEPRPITQDSPKNDDVNTKRTKITEPTSMVCSDRKGKPREETTRVKPLSKETPTTYRKNLEEENEKLLKTIDEKDQEIKRLKGALSSQVIAFDKIPKYSFSMPPRPQREELQVVHEALTSLRRCFPVNDPYQHTLDTIEQSLSALLERVNSLEMSSVSSTTKPAVLASTSDADPLQSLVHGVNFDSSGDTRRHPVPKISGLTVRHAEDNRTRNDASTKVVYYMDKSVTPFRCVLHKRIGEATLRDFKMLFDRPGQYRYHFKTLDPEFGMVKEEMLYDDDILPGWDGKIIAWVEEESS